MSRWPSDKKISEKTYVRRLGEIYLDSSLFARVDHLDDKDVQLVMQKEFYLLIDYRLGEDFPLQRRASLWEILTRVRKQQIRTRIKYLFRMIRGKIFVSELQSLIDIVANEFALHLNQDEYLALLGEEFGHCPKLPLDPTKLK